MSDLEIGMVGLGSSHPEAFGSIFAESDEAIVSAVLDRGDVRDREYVEWFCDEYDATEYDVLATMADAVDAVMIEAVNWDNHRARAAPFLEAGVPIFVEKPIAGRYKDVAALEAAAGDTPLFGGSAVPYHPALENVPRGTPGRTLAGAGYNDPFYYGVHVVDTVRALAGADWTAVTPVDGPGMVVIVQFENETNAMLRIEGPSDDPSFAILDVSDRTRATRLPTGGSKGSEMYRRFMGAWLEVIRGERDETGRVLDAARLNLGVQAALETGKEITPTSTALREFHEDGHSFLEEYRNR